MKRNCNEISTTLAKKNRNPIPFKRNTEHIDGNWPSHIYLKGKYNEINDISNICMNHYNMISKKSSEEMDNPMIPIDSPHISLSKPFVLRFHQIVPFIALLNESLQHIYSFNVEIPAQYKLLENEAKTRLFLTLPVIDLHEVISKLIDRVDTCLKQFQQPLYYLSPLYHISIASIPLSPDILVHSLPTTNDLVTLSSEDIEKTIQYYHTHKPLLLTASNIPNQDNNNNNNSDSDSEFNWQKSIQRQHHLLKNRCNNNNTNDLLLSNVNAATKTTYSQSHSAIATNNDVSSLPIERKYDIISSLSLLPDYESDDDNYSSNTSNILKRRKKKDNDHEHNNIQAGLSKILTINYIECKIGNKTYRLSLPDCSEAFNHSQILLTNNSFIECK